MHVVAIRRNGKQIAPVFWGVLRFLRLAAIGRGGLLHRGLQRWFGFHCFGFLQRVPAMMKRSAARKSW